jgi:transcriptional regulator GlxA family with amidase domain
MMELSVHSFPDAEPRPFVVSYILIPGFSMLALSSAIEPLRSANRLLGTERFRWNIIGPYKGQISASNGLEISAEYEISAAPDADLTIVVASLGLENFSDKKLMEHLRKLRRSGQMFGAISSGTLILAQAGVLHNRSATVHWESLDAMTAAHPNLQLSTELFRIDGQVYTAAGGAAAMDMVLELIASLEGRAIAADIADQFLHGVIRPSSDAQRADVKWRYRLTDRRLEKAIAMMEGAYDPPIKISVIASTVGISDRQLERLFRKTLGKTPSAFYLTLRLEHAHARLVGSTDSLARIAQTTGFSSPGHFSRAYKSWSGSSPLATRNRLGRDLSPEYKTTSK